MQLAPGPIPTVSVDFSTFPEGDPGFQQLQNDWGVLLDGALASMDQAYDPSTIIDDALPSDGSDDDLASLDSNLAVFQAVDTQGDENIADASIQDLSAKMIVNFNVMPGEAFQPVPDSLLEPPGSSGALILAQSAATLSNLTRPGDPNFFPGDQYQLSVQLLPVTGGAGDFAGVDVTILGSFAGAAFDPIDLCLTDANGILVAQGTFQLADVGDWAILVAYFVGGPTDPMNSVEAAPATPISFTVQPLPAGTPPPAGASVILGGGLHPVQTQGQPCTTGLPLLAVLTNTTRPDSQNFYSGDGWSLTITGQPGQDVLISAVFNGAALPWVNIGQTDVTGQLILTGTMTDDFLGSWVESFQVGGLVWAGSISFSVSATPPA